MDPLVRALRRPEAYAHRPAGIELRQTHISRVFLAGDLVYKTKKPVRFAFLDYSTLERRRHFCFEEVRLNRRLAPSVYLGVVPIWRRGEEFAVDEHPEPRSGWRIEEFAVKMRRLPQDHMLDRLVVDQKVSEHDVQRVVETLVPFHRSAATRHADLWGNPDAVAQGIFENLREAAPFVGGTISASALARIETSTRRFVERHRELLGDRVRRNRIREGHGDLRAEHVSLSEKVLIVDCLEFSERLRTGDVASEIAFLAMDLEFLGAPHLSLALARRYADASADPDLHRLLPFYQCYRAFVRGKVESLRSAEPDLSPSEREESAGRARRFFRFAWRYACPPLGPALIAVCGLSGTGKSTAARAIEDLTGFALLRSDVIRKELAGLRPTDRPQSADRPTLYDREWIERTYTELLARAATRLGNGHGVILDATFKSLGERRRVLDLTERAGVSVLFVECRAAEVEVLRRLRARARARDDASDADAAVYLRQKTELEPLSEIPSALRIVVDTTSGLALERVESWLCEREDGSCR